MSEERLVPKLRFEFPSNWKNKKLKDIIQISKEKYNPDSDKTSYKCIELEHLSQGNGMLLGFTDSNEQNSIKNKFHEGNILFGKLRPYLEKYYFPNFDGVCSSEIWVFDTKEYPKYIYYLIQTKRFLDIANVSSGSKMPRSDWNFMKDFIFPIPNIKTQKETSNLFTTIDKKIELLEKKHQKYQDFKKYLMQQIFTQKLRFNEEEIWKTVEVSSVVSEYKEKAGDNDYPVLSSTLSGIFLQSDYFDKNVNSSDTQDYKVVPKGYFTYRSMSDTGIFRFNIQNIIEKGIISPAYPVFTTRNINKCFLEEYLNNSPNIKRQILTLKEGGTRYALGFNKFKKLKIELPSSNEQNKIADCLKTMNTKIDNANNELKYLIEFKKGLIQQMFV